MNLQEMQRQIKDNELKDLYIFIGEEIAVQKVYIQKIGSIKSLQVQYVDSYKSIYGNIVNNDLFNLKKLYVIVDDDDILKQEDSWDKIKTNGNMIIFKFNNLDKRSKFYKYFEKDIVEFDKLSDEILKNYIKREVPLNDNNCKRLIEICGNNYNQILLEIDKIKNFEDARFQDSFDQVFEVLDSLGAFHKEVSDVVFKFVEAVVERNTKQIYDLQKQLKINNEPVLKIIGLLYSNIKTILLIQSCKSNDICKTTGLQSNQVYYNKDKTGYYSTGELVRALRILQKLESGIKTGKIEEQFALDYFIVSVI